MPPLEAVPQMRSIAKTDSDIVRSIEAETAEVSSETVAIVGLGYVGLPTAVAFATAGHSVIGVDVSRDRLARIRDARVDLLDADINRLGDALDKPSFHLTDDLQAIATADAVVICVPTPVDKYLVPDLAPLATACHQVVEHARPGQTLVLTSTTYVGSTRDLLVEPLARRGLRAGVEVHVSFSPERVDPGNAAHPQHLVPRIVGGVTTDCGLRAEALLSRITSQVYLVSTAETAEMTKLYENTFRAVNIALANEFASVSHTLGVEVAEVIEAAATKPYGFMPFYPGPGVGGHCIPCDPHYLLWQLRSHRLRMPIVEASMAAIAGRPAQVVDRVREVLAESGCCIRGARVLVVGVTYKPGVEDIRESPAIEILSSLQAAGANAGYWDERVPELRLSDGTALTSVPDPITDRFDLLLVHTRHPDADLSWVGNSAQILDATYRLVDIPHRAVV